MDCIRARYPRCDNEERTRSSGPNIYGIIQYPSLASWKETDSTVKIQNDEHLRREMVMNKKGPSKRTCQAYRWGNLCDGGKEEPQDTLMDQKMRRRTAANGKRHSRTCFQRRSPIPKVPPPSLRKRSNPTSTMKSNTMSVMTRTMMLNLLLSGLETTHCCKEASQYDRSYR